MANLQPQPPLVIGKPPSSSGSVQSNSTQLIHPPGMQILRPSGNVAENTPNVNGNSHLTTKMKTAPHGKKTKGRVKIEMRFIDNKLRRYTTFSKRKAGLMKKAFELSTLTGTEVMLLVASETGHVYTFATRKLQPMITSEAGKALIQTCLNSPDSTSPNAANPLENHIEFEESDLGNEDFDEADYMDDDEESSHGSPTAGPNATSAFMENNHQYASPGYLDNGEYPVNPHFGFDPKSIENGVHSYDQEEESGYSGNG